MRTKVFGFLLGAQVVSPAGCGSADPTLFPPGQRLQPLAINASWTYRVEHPERGIFDKSSLVEAMDTLDGGKAGVTAFRLRTERDDDDGDASVAWYEDRTVAVVRHRKQGIRADGSLKWDEVYDAFKLRVDESPERLVRGASWTESYRELRRELPSGVSLTRDESDRWVVEAVGDLVVVPAGRYRALRVRRISGRTGSEKTYWFAPGVGKVKEVGGQTEELTSYLPGA